MNLVNAGVDVEVHQPDMIVRGFFEVSLSHVLSNDVNQAFIRADVVLPYLPRRSSMEAVAGVSKPKLSGHAHRLHREPPALVWRDVKPEIAKRLSTIDRTFPRHWGAQYADVMDFVLPERGRVEPQTDNSDSNMPD